MLRLGELRLGLLLEHVREVTRAVWVTPLPEAPLVVEGVIDVRGTLVPVYDLRLRFGLPPRRLHPSEALVLARSGERGERTAAFRCDEAEQVESVSLEAVAGAAPLDAPGGLVSGVARTEEGLVLMHDPAAFLAQAEQRELDAALAAHAEGLGRP